MVIGNIEKIKMIVANLTVNSCKCVLCQIDRSELLFIENILPRAQSLDTYTTIIPQIFNFIKYSICHVYNDHTL